MQWHLHIKTVYLKLLFLQNIFEVCKFCYEIESNFKIELWLNSGKIFKMLPPKYYGFLHLTKSSTLSFVQCHRFVWDENHFSKGLLHLNSADSALWNCQSIQKEEPRIAKVMKQWNVSSCKYQVFPNSSPSK